MARLTERLNAAEEELAHLKRSCQFTALAEMLAAGEEYAKEVPSGKLTLRGYCTVIGGRRAAGRERRSSSLGA